MKGATKDPPRAAEARRTLTSGGDVSAPRRSERARKRWLAAAALAVVAVPLVAVAAGWDAGAWFRHAWASFTAVSPAYVAAALALQTAQVAFSAAAWHAILRYAYPDGDLSRLRVAACYATGLALNGFLPGNAGTLVTVMMLVAVVEPATPAGVLAASAVEKLFFAVAAAAVWVYLFVDVGGSFHRKLGFVTERPWATALVAAAVLAALVAAVRLAGPRLRETWAQARQGGSVLADRRAYTRGVLYPQLLAWLSRLGVVAVLLAAYGIPVSVRTVLRVVGGNSLGHTVSLTPGGLGVNQGLNVVSLHGVADAADAAAYSIGQQLLTTAWNVVLAVVLLVAAFGWSGARRLLRESSAAARTQRGDEGR